MNYHREISETVGSLLHKMDSLNISAVSSEFESLGIDIKFYLDEEGALLYVSNPEAIVNQQWVAYIKTAKQFDRNWYFVIDKKAE